MIVARFQKDTTCNLARLMGSLSLLAWCLKQYGMWMHKVSVEALRTFNQSTAGAQRLQAAGCGVSAWVLSSC